MNSGLQRVLFNSRYKKDALGIIYSDIFSRDDNTDQGIKKLINRNIL